MNKQYLVLIICGLSLVTWLRGSSTPELAGSVEVYLGTTRPSESAVKAGLDVSSRLPMWNCQYSLYCRNDSRKPVTIPTVGFIRNSSHSPSKTSHHMSWRFEAAPDGSALIRPNADYGFVTLLPGETALVTWTGVTFELESFKKLEVEYNVPSEFARRFGCWSGSMKPGLVKVLVDGRELGAEK